VDILVQARKAEEFRRMHAGPKILVLPNVWDVASARIVQEMKYPAIATTSAGVAFALGYPDGQRISRDEMLEAVARIAKGVNVPVTADMESGYGTTPKELAEMARAVIEAGAVGLNFEDVTGDDESSHVEISLQVEKIKAIREAAAAKRVPLVINARTDIYLMPIGDENTRYERTVERLRAYRKAGADCLFAPGLCDKETIGKLVRDLEAPVNILLSTGCPSLRELEKMGVARVSTGSAAMRVALGALRSFGRELAEAGTFAKSLEDAVPFAELNALMARRTRN
jgi:2-methylisocitrate lyase-like PEP mutase family enzyme